MSHIKPIFILLLLTLNLIANNIDSKEEIIKTEKPLPHKPPSFSNQELEQ